MGKKGQGEPEILLYLASNQVPMYGHIQPHTGGPHPEGSYLEIHSSGSTTRDSGALLPPLDC